jgi:hypothetical protein
MRRLISSMSSWEEKRSAVSPEEGVEGFLISHPVKSKAERGQQMLLNLFKLVTYLHLCIIQCSCFGRLGWCRRSWLFSKLLDYWWKLLHSKRAKKGVRTCTSQEDAITFVEIYAFNNGNLTRSCSSSAHLFMIYNVHPSQGQVLCSILYSSQSCSQETINWPVFCVPLGLALSSCINL